MAFAQTDLKRLVAYTSVSHMGFVLLGVFAWNELALQGAVMQVLAHGVSTGALFIIVGALQERIHTRDMDRMGGLWTAAPKMGAVALVFSLGALGLPGLGNFVAEFLVLIGTYQVNIAAAVLGAIGIVVATVYALWIMQRAFHGPNVYDWRIPDLNAREMLTLGVLIVVLVWLGLYPQPVFDAAGQAFNHLQPGVSAAPLATETNVDGAVAFVSIVIPAKAGIQKARSNIRRWIPAFAGMTVSGAISDHLGTLHWDKPPALPISPHAAGGWAFAGDGGGP